MRRVPREPGREGRLGVGVGLLQAPARPPWASERPGGERRAFWYVLGPPGWERLVAGPRLERDRGGTWLPSRQSGTGNSS